MWNRLSNATDAYLKERLHDLRDIADRLRLYLSGEYCNPKASDVYDDIVIVATSMGPADLMDYKYNIRVMPGDVFFVNDSDSFEKMENGKIIASYNSLEELVNDGWELD